MPESPVPPPMAAFLPSDLPSPLKAIAGIAVTMVHDVKHLPERAAHLPSSVLTHLAAKSLKVQQQYAAWVARGEEFLGSLQEPSEEIPSWATFDEDLPDLEPADKDDLAATLGLGPGSAFDLQAEDDLPVARRRAPHAATGGAVTGELVDAESAAKTEGEPTVTGPAEPVNPPKKAAPGKKAGPAPSKKAAPAKKAGPAKKAAAAKKPASTKAAPAATTAPPKAGPATQAATKKASAKGAATSATPAKPAPPSPSTPSPSAPSPSASSAGAQEGEMRTAPQSLPDFDTLTIPQLRTRLKTLRTPELDELIVYESAGLNRPAVVGMLRARLETLQK